MRVVLDTNIVVSALLWGGTPQQLLAAASEGQIEIYTSEPLLLELAEVLPRPEFAERIHKAQRTVNQLLEQYRSLAEIVEPAAIARVMLADPDDHQVLACALAARADLVVSGDKRLRNIKSYHAIPILDVTQALARLPQR